jgi:hypothetical protein
MAKAFELNFTRDSKKAIGIFQTLGIKEELFKEILRFFKKDSLIVAGAIIRKFLSGKRGTKRKDQLARRTGTLARSVTGQATLFQGLPAMRIGVFRGPALKYANIQDVGGTIKPRKAKALAIPVGPALTPAGVERFGGPRKFPGELRFIPFRSSGVAVGGLFEVKSLEKEKKAASRGERPVSLRRAKMYYLLVKQVKIKGVGYLSKGLKGERRNTSRRLETFLRNLLSGKEEIRV